MTEKKVTEENEAGRTEVVQRCVMRDALNDLLSAIDMEKPDPPNFEGAEKTFDSSYNGGDCSKHGRYYGICHSCRNDMKRHYEEHDREFKYQRDRAINEAARNARKILNA